MDMPNDERTMKYRNPYCLPLFGDLRGKTQQVSARDYIKLVPSTDQSRTLEIPILLRRLRLVIQIDLSSTRISLEVKAWAKTQQCLVNLGGSTATARLIA